MFVHHYLHGVSLLNLIVHGPWYVCIRCISYKAKHIAFIIISSLSVAAITPYYVILSWSYCSVSFVCRELCSYIHMCAEVLDKSQNGASSAHPTPPHPTPPTNPLPLTIQRLAIRPEWTRTRDVTCLHSKLH